MATRLRDRRPRLCHYCWGPAGTRDHIVPRSRVVLPGPWSGQRNLVPACASCNQRKRDRRSDCGCERCMYAWQTFGPPGWEQIPVVRLTRKALIP